MRQVTATEKYRAVNEGKMAKSEFVRQMRQQFPHFVSNYDGFDSTVKVLKYKGIIFETKVQEQTGQKVYDERPALTYSLDALDRGVRAELAVLGLDPAIDFVSKENLEKATDKAKSNLEKDANHYLNLMSGESNKVDKHDREKEVKRGAGDKDTFNDMKKATLKEGMYIDDEEWEKEMGRSPEDTEKAIDKEASKLGKEGIESARDNIIKVASVIRGKYGEIPGFTSVLKDFLQTHQDDIKAGRVTDPIAEFDDFVDLNYDRLDEKEGKDHDGDGDIDSDDYMAAKDKAIKKAMGKDPKEEQLKEAIKSIIKKTLLKEAATVMLADWADEYETFSGVKPVVNELENIVTEIETFYDKMSTKIANTFSKTADFENEEGLKIGGFIAPSLESAFKQDLSKVIKKGSFFSKINLPKVRTITQADIDAHNSGERPLGEQEPEKATLFTPVNENVTEAQTEKLSDFGKSKLFPYLSKLGFSVKAINGQISREMHDTIHDKQDSKLAAVSYEADGKGGEYVYLVVSKKNGGALDDVVKHFNLNTGGSKQVTQGWDTKDVKTASDNEIISQKEMNQGNMQLVLTRRGESSK